ncbi:transcriptional coactivator/pterin dehydratase [Dothidotthia symphoricarpi CBS 119687]|uniref:4a-hydroxytetrahydrobiopterin dehydratase n=1 Tax=Dothidotthia symphoricarpi CBS 119687 TaxID=1392245 RepID=A0A6A5ZX39_9PLEO|nr:transcriptional coactivator/pterin dehydratase [Dothidotthia symphoricarpi CBS 119687]KAF2123484.1 transcriptional coactivator/pterin dehydratase [Dothidotthia symphoricarpi CBS 119687]
MSSSTSIPAELKITLQSQVDHLIANSAGRWRVSNDGASLEAKISFPTFKKTWQFMDAVAAKAVASKHHPEWSNIYNQVFIRWTTHSDSILTDKDVHMAVFCEETALAFGATLETTSSSGLTRLIDQITGSRNVAEHIVV